VYKRQHENSLAAWCLSEYNYADRCEVGIATVEEYQQRGLGTVVGCAFVEEAIRRGYRQIGWHCWLRNQPSAALAGKIGYSLRSEEEIAIGLF
jgi:RimJ/RimL family protein N-acetyltransferase